MNTIKKIALFPFKVLGYAIELVSIALLASGTVIFILSVILKSPLDISEVVRQYKLLNTNNKE